MKIQLQHFDVLESTNTTAVAAAAAGAAEGTVIVADKQEGGHGRMSRVWNSPLGGLWFSIILRPQIDPQFAAQITLLTGVAVTRALRRLYTTDAVKIKWPNDVLLDGKKVCGILSELQLDEKGNVEYAVVGIGINVALRAEDIPAELSTTAASLNVSLDKSFTCSQVLDAFLAEFAVIYRAWLAGGAEAMLQLWRELNCTIGKHVLVKDNDEVIFTGIASAVDERGALMVQNTEGVCRSFDFGEISIRY